MSLVPTEKDRDQTEVGHRDRGYGHPFGGLSAMRSHDHAEHEQHHRGQEQPRLDIAG